MDTLALLCNLHAEGPATLQRLRRAGCESLVALVRFDAPELARRMDWSERVAERFLREAALLAERLDEEVAWSREVESESEADLAPEAGAAAHWQAEAGEDEEGEEVEADEADDEAEEEPVLEVVESEQVEVVLGAWRELDRTAPPEEPREYELPRASASLPAAPNRALEETRLEGLTPDLARRLGELGVLTLRGLIEAKDLELARKIPLGFTRLKRLQFLAARELALLPAQAAPPRPAPSFDFPLPPVERFETAGPFA